MLRSRLQRMREGRALTLACALHGVAGLALWRWTSAHAPRHAPFAAHSEPHSEPHSELHSEPGLDADELEVELETDESQLGRTAASLGPAQSAPTPPPTRRGLVSPPRLASALMNGTPSLPLAQPGEPVDAVQRSADGQTPASPPPRDTSPPARAVELGIGPGDWRRWLADTKSDGARVQTPHGRDRALFHAPPVSTTGGLQEGLEAHDRALGMGISGPVVSALYRAAHGDVAPVEGVARFRITVLQSGSVDVVLSDASGDVAGWSAVASKAAEALRRAPPRVPKPRKGARIVVEITAKETFPNGLQPKQLHGLRPELEPIRLRSVQSAQRELTDRNPVSAERAAPGQSASGSKANVNLPGVYAGARGKVCGYRVGWSLLGPVFEGGCDPSNLGAKPQRMVSTLVREETLY